MTNRERVLMALWKATHDRGMIPKERISFKELVELGDRYDKNFEIIHNEADLAHKSEECLKALRMESCINARSRKLRKMLGLYPATTLSEKEQTRSYHNERWGRNAEGNLLKSLGQRIKGSRCRVKPEEPGLRQDNGRICELYKSGEYDWLKRTASLSCDDLDQGSPTSRVNDWKESCKRANDGQPAGLDGVHVSLEGVGNGGSK